jgi:anthranilate 1,2-dioxygenase small subunit
MSIVIDSRAVERLYYDYAQTIDGGDIEAWPNYFLDSAFYQIISQENFDRGLPLGIMSCEGMGMLKDRAFASAKLNVYAPRTWRHLIGNICFDEAGDEIQSTANVVLFETIMGRSTQILLSGRYIDTIKKTDGALKFAKRVVVYDTTIIPGSVVCPI